MIDRRNIAAEKALAERLGLADEYRAMLAFGVSETEILRALLDVNTAKVRDQRSRMLEAMADYRLRNLDDLTDEVRQAERLTTEYHVAAMARGLPIFNV